MVGWDRTPYKLQPHNKFEKEKENIKYLELRVSQLEELHKHHSTAHKRGARNLL